MHIQRSHLQRLCTARTHYSSIAMAAISLAQSTLLSTSWIFLRRNRGWNFQLSQSLSPPLLLFHPAASSRRSGGKQWQLQWLRWVGWRLPKKVTAHFANLSISCNLWCILLWATVVNCLIYDILIWVLFALVCWYSSIEMTNFWATKLCFLGG